MPTDDLLGNHVDFIDPSWNGKLAPKVKKKFKGVTMVTLTNIKSRLRGWRAVVEHWSNLGKALSPRPSATQKK